MTTLIAGGTGLIGTARADQLSSGVERVVRFPHAENAARARAGPPALAG